MGYTFCFERIRVNAGLILVENLDHNDAIVTWGVDAVEWLNRIK